MKLYSLYKSKFLNVRSDYFISALEADAAMRYINPWLTLTLTVDIIVSLCLICKYVGI